MRILIVEDEQKIANAIKKGLIQESFAVDVAYDGKTGKMFALTEEYDLVILDRMLPDIEGLEIARAMREENVQTPILILTAKDQVIDKIEGLNIGADDYLAKPFAFEELLARIRALLRRPPVTTNPILKVGEITLNTNNFEVTKNNKKILLTTREFALLEYFMMNPERILTKKQIIDHVWNYDADILPNTVEVYIGYLRNKLQDKSNSLIKTIRGFGYKLGSK